jgi:enoyl-[acyl-carrier-protein] reductase (NADH)
MFSGGRYRISPQGYDLLEDIHKLPIEKTLEKINKRIPFENRMTTCEEIGQMVAFLLSEKSSHTTGQLIHVDGGYVHLDRAID